MKRQFDSDVYAETERSLALSSSKALAAFIDRAGDLKLSLAVHNICKDSQGIEERTEITFPSSALHLIVRVLASIANDQAVTILPTNAELTTQQAADLLRVSRKFFIDELLQKGKIPFRRVGKHRRILLQDLVAYQQENQTQRFEAIDEMVRRDQLLGLI